jgi:short-subunit dehydrogenase
MANSFEHITIVAVKVLARLAAKKAVQAELKAQGVRVTLVRPAEINAQAAEYLANHPELYQQALERAQRMTAEGVFGKRAQRAWAEAESVRKASGNRTLVDDSPTRPTDNANT